MFQKALTIENLVMSLSHLQWCSFGGKKVICAGVCVCVCLRTSSSVSFLESEHDAPGEYVPFSFYSNPQNYQL